MPAISSHPSAPWFLALALAVAPSADARERGEEVSATATIEWAYQPRSHAPADGILWRCDGDRCTARVVDTPAAAHRACYRLARRYGRVRHFALPSGALSEEALARCNGSRR